MSEQSSSNKRASLADVAAKAGVSKAAASYALRNTGKVSEETRQRVLQAARDLDYAPAATGIGPSVERGRSHDGRQRIAWLGDLPEADDPRCERALYRARDIGYRCDYFKAADIDDLRLWRMSLLRGGYRGLILASAARCAETMAVDWQPLATVCCEAMGYDGPYTSILAADPLREILDSFARARAAGHTRIGCIIHDRNDGLHQLRVAAAHAAYMLHSDCEPVPVHLPGTDVRHGVQFWCRVNRPEVVIGSDPSQLYTLRRDGVRAGFICIDCPPGQGGIAGTVVDTKAVGATAVNAIDQLLRFNRGGRPDNPRRITHAICWRPGASFDE